MLRAAIASLIVASFLFACASPLGREPSDQELENADYGPPPGDAEGMIRAHALVRYQDRGVAHVQVGTPRPAWYGDLGRLTEKRDIRYGWAVPFRGFKLGFASLEALAVEGSYYFRNGSIEAVKDDDGTKMLSPN